MYPEAWNRIHDEETAVRYLMYHLFDTLFGLLGSNQLYSVSTVDMEGGTRHATSAFTSRIISLTFFSVYLVPTTCAPFIVPLC